MPWKPEQVFLAGSVVTVVLIVVVGIVFLNLRTREADEITVGLTATASLQSPSGDPVGTVEFRQAAVGVLVMADLTGLAPGGHAFVIHETGACTPNFDAAGDHFDPTDAAHGFIHASWKRGDPTGGHGGDLLNIYAGNDGSARADFLTEGITLNQGPRHSVFDDDGSAIIVHEKPDPYGEEEVDTGSRVACGVITRN